MIYIGKGAKRQVENYMLTDIYHYTTKNVNKAIKRNINRFPEDFCFQLTKE